LDLFTRVLQEYGYTCSWAQGQQYLPPTAAAGGKVLGADDTSVAAAEALLEEFDIVPWLPSKAALVSCWTTCSVTAASLTPYLHRLQAILLQSQTVDTLHCVFPLPDCNRLP
jgi:hypothetical protein